MITASSMPPSDVAAAPGVKARVASHGASPAVLADVYGESVNIAVWQRDLSAAIQREAAAIIASNNPLEAAMTVTPESALPQLEETLGTTGSTALGADIAEMVDMFCCLFDLRRAGLRLSALKAAMCPRFHVDRVPCRLLLTYHGVATEWLSQQAVDRSKLGRGNAGLADKDSGLYQDEADIQRLSCGDVALLKGELWEGNEDAGLVHRSPAVPAGTARLILSLDFSG